MPPLRYIQPRHFLGSRAREREAPNEPSHGSLPMHLIAGFAQFDQPKLRQLQRAVTDALEQGKKISLPRHELDENYLKHVVRSLAEKQFEPDRAVVELISNAIDAVSETRDKRISVSITRDGITVSDNGRGMTHDEMLTALSAPYRQAEEKAALGRIGRFGVGFFSNLSFLANNLVNDIRVHSRFGDSPAHLFTYSLEHGEGGNEYFVAPERKRRDSNGTTVTINGRFSRAQVKSFVENARYFFEELDPSLAVLTINGRQVKAHKMSKAGEREVIETPSGDVIMRADFRSKENVMRFTQGGSLINELPLERGKIVVELPTSIRPGEGRRGFVIDDNYLAAMHHSFRWLLGYVRRKVGGTRGWPVRALGAFEHGLIGDHRNNRDQSSPMYAFALLADDKQIRNYLQQHAPFDAPLSSQRLLKCENWNALSVQRFIGKEAYLIPELHHMLDSPSLLYNPNIPPLGSFFNDLLRKGQSTTSDKLSAADRERFGLDRVKDGLPVHLVELSPQNDSPFLACDAHSSNSKWNSATPENKVKEGLYVNVSHPLFSNGSVLAHSMVEHHAKRALKQLDAFNHEAGG